MEKVLRFRFAFWLFVIFIIGVSSLASCEKDEFESDFPILVDGSVKINTTYRLKGITEFDVILTQQDTNVISVRYGKNLAISAGVVSGSARHIVVNGDFVRFSSSDYDTKHNVERYDAEIKVSNLK